MVLHKLFSDLVVLLYSDSRLTNMTLSNSDLKPSIKNGIVKTVIQRVMAVSAICSCLFTQNRKRSMSRGDIKRKQKQTTEISRKSTDQADKNDHVKSCSHISVISYLRQSQATLGPVTWPNPGVRVHHVYMLYTHMGAINPNWSVRQRRMTWCFWDESTFIQLSDVTVAAQIERRTVGCVTIQAGRDCVRTEWGMCAYVCVRSYAWIHAHRMEGRGELSVWAKRRKKQWKQGRQEGSVVHYKLQSTSCFCAHFGKRGTSAALNTPFILVIYSK